MVVITKPNGAVVTSVIGGVEGTKAAFITVTGGVAVPTGIPGISPLATKSLQGPGFAVVSSVIGGVEGTKTAFITATGGVAVPTGSAGGSTSTTKPLQAVGGAGSVAVWTWSGLLVGVAGLMIL